MGTMPPCDSCEAPQGDMLITNLHTGDTLALCMTCLPAWVEQLVSQLDQLAAATVEPEPAAPVVEDPHAPKLQRPPKGARSAAKAGTARKAPPRAVAPPVDAEEAPEGSDEDWEASARTSGPS